MIGEKFLAREKTLECARLHMLPYEVFWQDRDALASNHMISDRSNGSEIPRVLELRMCVFWGRIEPVPGEWQAGIGIDQEVLC